MPIVLALPFVITIKSLPVASFWSEWISAMILTWYCILRLRSSTQKFNISLLQLVGIFSILLTVYDILMKRFNYIGNSIIEIYYILLTVILIGIFRQESLKKNKPHIFFEIFSKGMLIAGFINFIVSIIQINDFDLYGIHLFSISFDGRVRGILGQSNHMATTATLSVFSMLYLIHRNILKNKLYIYFLMFINILLITLTGSRTGLLSLILLSTLAFFIFDQKNYSAHIKKITLAIFPIILITQLIWSAATSHVYNAEVSLQRFSQDNARLSLYKDALTIFENNWLFGIGWRKFSEFRWEHLTNNLLAPNSNYPHNFVLDILVSWGLLGGLFIVAPIIYIYAKVAISLIKKKNSLTGERIFGYLFSAVIFIHCLLEYPYAYLHFLFIWMLFLDIAYNKYYTLQISQSFNNLKKYLTFLVVIMPIFLALDYSRYASYGKIDGDLHLKMIHPKLVLDEPLPGLTLFDYYYMYLNLIIRGLNTFAGDEKLLAYKNIRSEIISAITVAQYIEALLGENLQKEATDEYTRSLRNEELNQNIVKILCLRAKKISLIDEFIKKDKAIQCS